jgi:hypothetical protein
MSAFLIAFLAMAGASLVVLAVTGIPVLGRLLVLRKRSKALQTHRTLIALRSAQRLSTTMQGMPARLDAISERSERIGEAVGALLASSAMLRLQVDRVSFATRLFLETFVPTLRGSMVD